MAAYKKQKAKKPVKVTAKKKAAVSMKKEKGKKSTGKKQIEKKGKPAKVKAKEKKTGIKKIKRKVDRKLKLKISRKKFPTFRGRFGNKYLRSIKKAKWKKWRHPRGIDISKKQEDGALPVTGYRTEKSIRFLHPSGSSEITVHNTAELEKVGDKEIARIASNVGAKKRKIIIKEAKKKEIPVINRGARI